jgi:S1-C subfamily serine protease
MSKLADLQKQAAAAPPPSGSKSTPGGGIPTPSKQPSQEPAEQAEKPDDQPEKKESVPATLGVEVVDVPEGEGALVVGVHVPGPGYSAGLVRGDVLLAFGETRIDAAADLARAVAAAQPGTAVTLTVRHANGNQQQLSTTPGVVT